MNKFFYLFLRLIIVLFFAGISGIFILLSIINVDMPDYKQLVSYTPPAMTRFYAQDSTLFYRYFSERRIFVSLSFIPSRLKDAFIAAEDERFYRHNGVDFLALFRALFTDVYYFFSHKRLIGASTITQQVVKNVLLFKDVQESHNFSDSVLRKVKQVVLALRLERVLSKDKILELYLNYVFLGHRAYGVAEASQVYFGKSLSDLTIAECALLATLPKAPSHYDPFHSPQRTLDRRNWVLSRMESEGFISQEEKQIALQEPLHLAGSERRDLDPEGDYFASYVLSVLEKNLGSYVLRDGALNVYTTLDPRVQRVAENSLRQGLMAYDKRHGYRGPLGRISHLDSSWSEQLQKIPFAPGAEGFFLKALILKRSSSGFLLGFSDQSLGLLKNGSKTAWYHYQSLDNRHFSLRSEQDVLHEGDVVLVSSKSQSNDLFVGQGPDFLSPVPSKIPVYQLEQMPEVEGAVVVLDPFYQRVLAIQGGWNMRKSVFNRAIQSRRQMGSSFKPLVYSLALEKGYQPNDLLSNSPLLWRTGNRTWIPQNFGKHVGGNVTIREAVEHSINLPTVRLFANIGVPAFQDYLKLFALPSFGQMNITLASALGSGGASLLDMTAAYGVFLNGGLRVHPFVTERIQERYGHTIFRKDDVVCLECNSLSGRLPQVQLQRERILSQESAFQMLSLLQGVVEHGTGRLLNGGKLTLAGKTGTTNKNRDAWFLGMTSSLVIGVFVGYDDVRELGRSFNGLEETAARVALPIFGDVAQGVSAFYPAEPFFVPPGMELRFVDGKTGDIVPFSRGARLEYFKN